MKKYDYMIKTVDEELINGRWRLVGFDDFIYPRKKGAIVRALDWTKLDTCWGGIFGCVHETAGHYVADRPIWIILKYRKKEAIIVDNNKIKVPRARMVAWGKPGEIQDKFKQLTGVSYSYDYAVQRTEKNGSHQIATHHATQIAGNDTIQHAHYHSTQIAGKRSIQCAQGSSTQTAGDMSVSVARGDAVICEHTGKVLQVLICDNTFYIKIINDTKRHLLSVVDGQLRDKIIDD